MEENEWNGLEWNRIEQNGTKMGRKIMKTNKMEYNITEWNGHPIKQIILPYVVSRGCQIGMQGPQLCTEPRHFCKLDVATSRMAFFRPYLHVLQVATSQSNN